MPDEKKEQENIANKKDELSDKQLGQASGGYKVAEHDHAATKAEHGRPNIDRLGN